MIQISGNFIFRHFKVASKSLKRPSLLLSKGLFDFKTQSWRESLWVYCWGNSIVSRKKLLLQFHGGKRLDSWLAPSSFPLLPLRSGCHRACALAPLLFPHGKTHLRLLETGVEAHLPRYPLLELDSHETVIPRQPFRRVAASLQTRLSPKWAAPGLNLGEVVGSLCGCRAQPHLPMKLWQWGNWCLDFHLPDSCL